MTNPVSPPAAPAVPVYPSLGSPNFNQEAYTYGSSMPDVSAGIGAIGDAAYTNAVAADERAVAANNSAVSAAAQADAAMGYRNTAQAEAATATTKAAEADASAIAASKLNLGDKAVEPTTDNQGAPLRAGATYYDTTLAQWRVWNGTAWVAGLSIDVANDIHTAAAKPTPADADEIGYVDSAAGWGLVKLTWANLKAVLLAYFKGQFREKLTAARTYYVRTDGSDSNDGLSNTAGGAFLTIQRAIDVASALDNGGFDVTISLGTGTFTGMNVLKSFVGPGKIVISGAGAGSTVVQVSTASTTCFLLPSGAPPLVGMYDIVNMTLQATAEDCIGIDLGYGQGGAVTFGGIEFGSFPAGVHLRAGHGALLSNASRGYSISGNTKHHIYCSDGGQVRTQAATVTLSGTVTMDIFVVVQRQGNVLCSANTYSGTASGTKYLLDTLSYALGVSAFPGSTAGTADATSVAAG